MSGKTLTVGETARSVHLSRRAVRLYEARGLIPAARRTEGGYRVYSRRDLDVLRFIRQARALGLGLDEIKQVIELQRDGSQPCVRVAELLDGQIRKIDRAIADLTVLRNALQEARSVPAPPTSRQENPAICQIIESRRGG